MAKYKDWLKPKALEKIKMWARQGLTNEQIASEIGINKSTLQSWLNKYDELSDTIKKGREHAVGKVENSIYRKAIGYYEGDKYYPPDTASCIFLLKSWDREHYRDSYDSEIEVRRKNLENEKLELQNEVLKKSLEVEDDGLDTIRHFIELLEKDAKDSVTAQDEVELGDISEMQDE